MPLQHEEKIVQLRILRTQRLQKTVFRDAGRWFEVNNRLRIQLIKKALHERIVNCPRDQFNFLNVLLWK